MDLEGPIEDMVEEHLLSGSLVSIGGGVGKFVSIVM